MLWVYSLLLWTVENTVLPLHSTCVQQKKKETRTYMFYMKAQRWSVTRESDDENTTLWAGSPVTLHPYTNWFHSKKIFLYTHVFQFHYNTHEVWWIRFKTQWNKWNDQKSHVQASLLLHNHWDATWARMIATTSDRLQKGQEKIKVLIVMASVEWLTWLGLSVHEVL